MAGIHEIAAPPSTPVRRPQLADPVAEIRARVAEFERLAAKNRRQLEQLESLLGESRGHR